MKKSYMEEIVFGIMKKPRKDLQDCRHLSKQNGFNILQGGDKHNGILLKRGEYCFLGFDKPNKFYSFKRRTDNCDFKQIKLMFDNCCATCGGREGDKHRYTNHIIKLEKGHKDPSKEMINGNIIPQCGFCNKKYKNRFIFDEFGQISSITDEYLL